MSSKPGNQKRRNNEKRKEKSRVAARCRRTKEMQVFSELTSSIPAKKEELEQLDKASIMRLAISYLRTREVVSMLPDGSPHLPVERLSKEIPEGVSSELSCMKAMDGFVLVLSQHGDIVYCSENISEHLGISQMEVMGQSVFELSHPCDHDDVREALRSSVGRRRDFLLRLKCTLTSKGRNVHLKSATYKVIHVTGHMLLPADEKEMTKTATIPEDKTAFKDGLTEKILSKISALVAVGRPIPHPSNIEIPLGTNTFLSKHSLDMKFTYTDDSLQSTLGFDPDELLGRPLYEYHHAADSASLALNFKSLFSKGQCETGQYRFLAKSGGYMWVQTQATVITDKQQKPISIVCVNYIVSGIECKDEVFATHQLRYAELKPTVAATVPDICTAADAPNGAIIAVVPSEEARPIPATELIFAPRTKEMNKGFLMFSQDEGHTMLKDEPEDLTHLAPTAGDACIPLENSPFDIFDDFILNDNYCSLLGDDDLANGSPVDSLAADSLLLSSPEPLDTDSSCEPTSLLTDFSLDGIEAKSPLEDGKSPFIPNGDELPVIAPAVMWGALPDNVSLARPQPSEPQTTSPAPALQRLLAGPPTGPLPHDLITNIYSYQGLISNKDVSTWDSGAKRVLKQEDEPSAKRVKRTPSPTSSASTPAQTSSVLMNLLGSTPQQEQLQQGSATVSSGYQMVMQQQSSPQNQFTTLNRHISSFKTQNNTQGMPNNSPNYDAMIRGNIIPVVNNLTPLIMQNLSTPRSLSSPLSLNIGSPLYTPSGSSNCSPAMSPIHREHLLSPYPHSPSGKFSPIFSPVAARYLSPGGILHVGSDPYLTNKMMHSPNFPLRQEDNSDVDMLLSAADCWVNAEIFQESNDLLAELDYIKLE